MLSFGVMRNFKQVFFFSFAAILAILGFNGAIVMDGSITSFMYKIITYTISPLILNNPIISTLVSLLSAALTHSFATILLVFPILYILKSNHNIFIIGYIVAVAGYTTYQLNDYLEISLSLIIFIVVRIYFQSMWLLLWLLTDKYKSLRL